MYHYRTRDQVEADLVLEDRRGKVVAIDVKASSTVRADDFGGIGHLESRLGGDLVLGLVLYTGRQTVNLTSGDTLLLLRPVDMAGVQFLLPRGGSRTTSDVVTCCAKCGVRGKAVRAVLKNGLRGIEPSGRTMA